MPWPPHALPSMLAKLESGDVAPLLALASTESPAEEVCALSVADMEHLWRALTPIVESALEAADPAMQPGAGAAAEVEDESVADALQTLHAVAIVASASIADKDREAPEPLVEIATALHDIIFDLTDPRASALQAEIVDLCEAWWLGERAGRDELVPQTVSYMLVRALHELATAADVKRLYAFRSSLTVLDYADESVVPLKRLLLHCAIRPLVLRCAEGRKLVAYFFSLHVPLISELHRAIKSQIPSCRKSQREAYGEVYFRAWRAASGPYLSRIEEGCLQDLMFHALHASSTSMANSVRQVLNFTHEQKRQRGVDAMLLKLWEPILWRALKVANPNVRKNAATLFIDAFPLQDASLPAVELDMTLQKQFDALSRILKDDAVGVRVVAVHGVCRILALFWDLIPSATTKALLTTLARDLAHDAAANSVRVAVLVGLKYLLAQNGSAPVVAALKTLLTPLASLLHDGSERVRVAFLDLLLAVSKLKALPWQTCVKPEGLLARLPIERPEVQMRLTRLLLPLYLPSGKPAQQLSHASAFVALATSGSAASRALLTHTPKFATAAASLRLVRLHLGALLSDSDISELLDVTTPVAKLPPRETRLPLSAMVASLEALAVLVESLAPALAARGELAAAPPAAAGKKSGSKAKKAAASAEDEDKEEEELEEEDDDDASGASAGRLALGEVLDDAAMRRLSELAKESISAQRALTRIAAWLPAEMVPELSADCMRQIASAPPTATAERLAPLISCACAWRLDASLMAMVREALGGGATNAAAAGLKRGRKSKGGAGANADNNCALSCSLALRVLWAALGTAPTREVLLERQSEALRELLPLLADLAAASPAADGGGSSSRLSTSSSSSADEAYLALSCFVQLSWHLAADASTAAAKAAAEAATTGGATRKGSNARVTKATKAAAEAEAAESAAVAARAAGRGALDMIMQWTTSGATPTSVPSSSTGVLGESRHNRGGDGLSTPGAARPKSRPRTTSSPDENADANQEQLTPTQGGGKARVDTFAGVDESDEEGEAAEGEASLPAAAALAGRVVTCAWLAEGCMLGMLEGQLTERSVAFLIATLRGAAAADDQKALAQLVPHACKMIPLLIEGGGSPSVTSAVRASNGGSPAESDGAERSFQLAIDLLFTLLRAGASSAAAARAARPLMLETLTLAQTAPHPRAQLLVRKLVGHVVHAIGDAEDAATWYLFASGSEAKGVTSLKLPSLTAEVAEVLTLRSAGCSAHLLPALEAMARGSLKDDRAEVKVLGSCVRWLLACESLCRAELPGRLSLRRALEGAGAEAGAASEASALGKLATPLSTVVGYLAE